MIKRGWFFNADKDSPFFDLKFTLSSTDIDFDSLKEFQMVNHFKGVGCITTKSGLVQTLKKLNFFGLSYQDRNQFFPRSYDLSSPQDIYDFYDDFYCLHAEGALTRLLKNKILSVNLGVVRVLCEFLTRRKSIMDDSFVDIVRNKYHQCFSVLESKIILNAHEWLYRPITKFDVLAADAHTDMLSVTANHGIVTPKKREKEVISNEFLNLSTLGTEDIYLIKEAVGYSDNDPQKSLSGKVTNNLWILKPAGKSRGRGIAVIRSLTCIMNHIKRMGSNCQFIVQKYIENPLIIAGRKFDIRQWIMVTGDKNFLHT